MEDWQVCWKYYQKPTTANVRVSKDSAMEENANMNILHNDLIRRLLNTKRSLGKEYREQVIDRYGQKLLNSGYSRSQVVKILVAGIKGY